MYNNPLLHPTPQVNQTSNQMDYYRQILKQISSSTNPSMMMQNFLQQNPNLNSAINLINIQKDPKQAFYNLARERGIDPDNFIQQLLR